MANPAAHHDDHHHDDGHAANDAHHGVAHVASIKVLLTTWITLMILTVLTVGATKVDFGSSINLGIAMAIAVVKATLVVLFFMHLFYDKLFHSIIIIGGVLAASLFIGFTLMDSNQYQDAVIWTPTTVVP